MNRFLPLDRLTILIAFGFLVLFSPSIYADEQPGPVSPDSAGNLTYYTEQLPPYNYEDNGTVKGFTVDILKEISNKSHIPLSQAEIHVVPWEEGYQAARTGNNTGLFATARTPDREDMFKWVGPISMERYVLFALPDRNISVQSPADLKGLRIGAITGDASVQLLKTAGVNESQLVLGTTAAELIDNLKNNETDLWVYPEFTGRYYAELATGDYYAFTVVYLLDETGIYYAFSKDVPDSTINSLQKSLDAIKEEKDGTGMSVYGKILETYVPKGDTNSTGSL